jgi:hypothetical protein
MEIRFHIDPETGEPHIHEHGIMEEEARQVLRGPGEEIRGTEDSRIKIGRTYAGRYVKVVYVPDEFGDGVFVITAYELRGKAKAAFRRRQRRKPR